jgi:hypothetical protein
VPLFLRKRRNTHALLIFANTDVRRACFVLDALKRQAVKMLVLREFLRQHGIQDITSRDDSNNFIVRIHDR